LIVDRVTGVLVLLVGVLLAAHLCAASPPPNDNPIPSIFEPQSTPADSIYHLSRFVLSITALIFLVVFSLLSYVVVKFRGMAADMEREPAQVYGSTQIELAWTVIPILIVVVLFLAAARVIHAIQDAPKPSTAVAVTVIGHQFWWEFRYPALGIVTANELHIPVSDPFFWQFPHFMAIAWMYREDYARAGYLVLPAGGIKERFVIWQSFVVSLVLIPLGLFSWATGAFVFGYCIGILVLGSFFSVFAARFAFCRSNATARQLLFASIVYLPATFVLMMLSKK
jgi:Cytochrome C oxidase subunit II, transmembrane domain